jgi:predicted transcriptional regulator
MAKQKADSAKRLGPLEARVMEALWTADEPLTVRELLGGLNRGRREPLAYTTVMTVMNRLAEKGALRRKRRGRGYSYEPTADDAAGLAVQSVVREFGAAAVAQFVDQARADPKLLRRLERILEDEQ